MSRLAIGTLNGRIKMIMASTNEVLFDVQGHRSYVKSVAISPDGQTLATASDDGCCKLWNANDGAEVFNLRGHDSRMHCLCTLDEDGMCYQQDPNCPNKGHGGKGKHPGVMAVAWSIDGHSLASGGKDGVVIVFHPNGSIVYRLHRHSESVLAVAFSPDGRKLATAGMEGKVHLWTLTSGEVLRTLVGHPLGVLALAFQPDSQRVATAGFDRQVKVWDVETGEHIMNLAGHREPVRAVSFSPDGKKLLSCSDDMAIRVWHPVSGKALMVLKGHDFQDGCLCDKNSGIKNMSCLVRGHRAGVRSLAFSPDGLVLASGSYDRTARIMDATKHSFDVMRRVAIDTEVVSVALGYMDPPKEAKKRDSEWAQSFLPRLF